MLHLYSLKLWDFVVIWCCFCSVTKSCLTFATSGTEAHQPSLSFTKSQSLLKLMSIESVIPSKHLILCCLLLFLPSVDPSIRVFSEESALRIRRPKNWSFNFSISPSNEYSGLISFRTDWLISLLAKRLSLISLLAKRLSRVYSNTPQSESVSSSELCLLYGPSLTSLHDYWKTHSFGFMDLCWQCDVSIVICAVKLFWGLF